MCRWQMLALATAIRLRICKRGRLMENRLKFKEVPVVRATRENTVEYGLFIGPDVPDAGLTIPFYKGTVEEGHNFPFECTGSAVVRSARISGEMETSSGLNAI